jgi:ATP dependent DNA ligase domain
VLPITPKNYIIQPKFNGWSLVIPGDGSAWTRRGNSITSWKCFENLDLNFPYPLHAELVATSNRAYDVTSLRHKSDDFKIIVHDVMVVGIPIEDRIQIAKDIVPNLDPFYVSPFFCCLTWDEVKGLFEIITDIGHEGIVLKRMGSSYLIGQTGSIQNTDWYKIKNINEIPDENN